MGTHAHELMMITAKLLACYDDAAGSASAPVPVSALLAHLLFLRANGGGTSATALADTFGTAAFVEVCGHELSPLPLSSGAWSRPAHRFASSIFH